MASTDALPLPRKNTAFRVTFPILDVVNNLVVGASGLDSEVSKDAGTFADCTNEATEIATNSGMYYLDLTASEMNADCVAVIVKTSSVDAKTVPIILYPEETGDIRVNATAVAGTVQTAGDLAALIVAAAASISAAVAALNNVSAAQVKSQVVAALATDTYAEPGQGAPAATLSLAGKIGYLFKSLRNKKTQTSTTFSLFADDGTTVDQKSTVSDDGTTATRGEVASGP